MKRIIPSPFGIHQWMLTALAITAAMVVWLLYFSKPDATDEIKYSVIIAAILMGIIARQERTFFIGLLAVVLWVGVSAWSLINGLIVLHKPLSRELFLFPCTFFLFYVLTPTLIAWVVTMILKRARQNT